MDYSNINIDRLILDAQDLNQDTHTLQNKDKTENLRGGNSGCLTADDKMIGDCARKAVARSLGLEFPPDRQGYMYFSQGLQGEDEIVKLLSQTFEGEVKCEEDTATCWETPSGRKVTGRPDAVLYADGKPKVGLEIKTVCSTSTGENVYYKDEPQLKHLCQAGHYAMELDVPFELVYWNCNSLDCTYFLKKALGDFRLKVPPYICYFGITFKEDDHLYIYSRKTCKETKTPITKQGIRDYYQLADEMLNHKTLGIKLTGQKYDGKKLNYSPCAYCDYAEACDQTNDFDTWVDMTKALIADKKKEIGR